ncbi:hypothetical protein [Lutimonas zeaxanthinifaciens]|uniref:hypothetical protein n=1 Tax=Lutimonas zeaxanthinifaciens TaxID=3060215 RepID=UPI00265D0580|nr:hypothetical protein [Lutimonas sp. YSD2104]WKK66521.1 hypothetical protein QZH61_02605 [Lutimonas sp. YSD2104]
MPTVKKIAIVLFNGLYDYVPKDKLEEYNNEFFQRQRFDARFVMKFFPRYIDFEKWVKNPKQEYDVLLFNYWLTEVCTYGLNGLKGSTMINEYHNHRNRIINRRLKERAKSKLKSKD